MEEKYIELLLNKCIKKDTKILFIHYRKEIIAFIKMLVNRAKDKGIEDIYLDCEDIYYTHNLLKNITIEEIDNNPYFNKSIWDKYASLNASFLIFETEYPNLFDDIDDTLVAYSAKVSRNSRPIYREKVAKCELSWCIAAYPSKMWADYLFEGKDSYEKLKTLIFKACMVDKDNPSFCWDKQLQKVNRIISILNKLNIEKLHYSNRLGTNLDIYLPNNYLYAGGNEGDVIVNMPSYEVFTSPLYNKTEGIVYSSKPLNYNGKIIDKFWLKFVKGRVVDYDAIVGREVLKEIINSDTNSCYLGECALVEYDSPISNMNINFGTTLIDENASCHLALGAGFAECIKGGLAMEKDELLKSGINVSRTHIDFIIGTSDLSITGTTYLGEEIVIFENGNFSKELMNKYDIN